MIEPVTMWQAICDHVDHLNPAYVSDTDDVSREGWALGEYGDPGLFASHERAAEWLRQNGWQVTTAGTFCPEHATDTTPLEQPGPTLFDECRPVEVVVDGDPAVVSVLGAAPLDDAGREALAEVVRAAIEKAKADLEPVEDPGYVEDQPLEGRVLELDPWEFFSPRRRVISNIEAERERQDARWGEQNHPNGTGPNVDWADGLGNLSGAAAIREDVRETCQGRFALGAGTWLDIALEEVAEAFAEDDPVLLRAELVQAAAVFVTWVEAIDRNHRS